MADVPMTIDAHDMKSDLRTKEIIDRINQIDQNKLKDKLEEETTMEPTNIFANPAAGLGAGLGGGVLGGALTSLLLGRNGLNGADGVGVVTPTMLTAALNQVQDNTNAATAASERLTQSRFDAEAQREIQAAIERTAAATQLAGAVQSSAIGVEIAKGQGEVTTQIALTSGATQTQAALLAGNLNTQNALNAAAAGVQVQKISGEIQVQNALGDAAIQVAVAAVGTANALAFKDVAIGTAQSTYALANAIKSDGDITRGLIVKQNDDMLNRLLTTAQNEIIELRGDRDGRSRARETEVNVTQSVTTNQNNLQAQQQQQQQFQILANLNAAVCNLANDIQAVRQTQSNVNFGVQGTAGQTASAANTRVN